MAFREIETAYSEGCPNDLDLRRRLREIRFNDKTYILDVGCGIGKVSYVISQEYPYSTVVGFDISEKNVHKAKNITANSLFLRSNEINMPFRDNCFDIAVSRMSFHHYPDPLMHLSVMHDVLKKDGIYLIIDILPNEGIEDQVLNKIFHDAEAQGVGDGHEKFYTKLEYEKMAIDLDLEIDFQSISKYKVTWQHGYAFHDAIHDAMIKSPMKFRKILEFYSSKTYYSYVMKMVGIILKR